MNKLEEFLGNIPRTLGKNFNNLRDEFQEIHRRSLKTSGK